VPDRREFAQAALAASLLSLDSIALGARAVPAVAGDGFPYGKPKGIYPDATFVRDALSLHFGGAKVDKTGLFTGWDDEIIAYGMAPEPVGKAVLRQFYTAVFTAFPDFTLVSDSLIVAGDMGAHRYHAMGTHLGGPNPTGARIMFRGQTVYRINAQGKVAWRVSNHDHGFRESQIAYAARRDHDSIARSWAPDPYGSDSGNGDGGFAGSFPPADPMLLPEARVRDTVAALMHAASTVTRSKDYWSFYRPDTVIHGLVASNALAPARLTELRAQYDGLWAAIPDLKYTTDELIVCGAYAIQQYSAIGRHSRSGRATESPNGRLIRLREQTVYRFDEQCRIAERWINHDTEFLSSQLASLIDR
jgi:predicted ester cyclase